jgi:excisionase family DNA binding protein
MKPTDIETESSPYLDYGRASEYCGVSVTTIWRATKRGDLRVSGPNGVVRFHKADLDAWMRGRSPK